MLKKIVKEEGSTDSERYLAKLASKSFFSLWSYPNLYRDEGITKNGIGQETADLMVVFGDTVIIFSDKKIGWTKHSDVMVNWGRWYRSSVISSAKQLYGSEAFIRKHPERIFLDKYCKLPFPINLGLKDLKVHLVAVTGNSKDAAKAYFDSFALGSNPTLMCNFHLDEKEVLKQPFFVTDIDPSKTFIHVFDELSLDLVINELGTISDFIHYLKTKEQAIRKLNLQYADGEEEILGFYLQEHTADGFGDLPFPNPKGKSDAQMIRIPEGEWANFVVSNLYSQFSQVRARAARWGALLDLFSEAIVSANTEEANDFPIEMHERALRCMASENRVARALLSDALYEKYFEVPTDKRSSRLVLSPYKPSLLYIFLFFPKSPSIADYQEYRRERRAAMDLYALVARYKFPDIKEILVLGADTFGSLESSETVVYLDASEPLNVDEVNFAKEVMTDMEILNTIPVNSMKARPKRISGPALSKRQGRNEQCGCGSGLKYKKCCANVDHI